MNIDMEGEMEKIELYHHSIEEIMGAPPAKSIAWGSGLILMIILVLLTGSVFINSPDYIRVDGVVYGETPITVLTAPVSGQIVFSRDASSKQRVQKNELIFQIEEYATKQTVPIIASLAGVFKINPLVRIRKNVFQNDTIGTIWSEKPAPVVCILELPNAVAQKVKTGQLIRVFTDPGDKNFMEAEIRGKTDQAVTSQTQFIAVLLDQSDEDIQGTLTVCAEVIIGEKNLFQQLVNPFRGLRK